MTALGTPAGTERPPLEVADVVRAHGAAFLARHGPELATARRRALQDVAVCRTAALGGHVQRCAGCGNERPSGNNQGSGKFSGGAAVARESSIRLVALDARDSHQ